MYNVDLNLIKNTRLKKGYTIEQMSGILNLKSKSSYFKRENGAYAFKADEIPILSKTLNLSYEKIFESSLRKSKL
ncbi:helix-turn-helix domain-containing protein [Companilactobacillus muriivasis]|uniref:helix-turn-helix domain-containing protein n=1 Tax=Companilactobacillus muriivasis TaxID=3081444 RepID=UPI0030C74A98